MKSGPKPKNSIKRRIPALIIIASGSLFILPVEAAVLAASINSPFGSYTGLEAYTWRIFSLVGFGHITTILFMLAVSLICGVGTFVRLNAEERDFATDFFGGIFILIIPYILSLIITSFIAVFNRVPVGTMAAAAATGAALNLIYFFVAYSAVVMAGVFAARPLTAVLGVAAALLLIAVVYFTEAGRFLRGKPMILHAAAALSAAVLFSAVAYFLCRRRRKV